MTIQEIATWLQGEVVGDASAEIVKVAKIEEAEAGSLSFLANPKYERFLATTHASAVLVSKKLDLAKYGDRASVTFIRVDDPYAACLKVLKRLAPTVEPFTPGIHPTAIVAPSAKIGANVALGAHVVIGENAVVGENTKVGPCCVIGAAATIGSDCLLYSHAVVYHQCVIGNRVTLHTGAVIGGDGFGFARQSDGQYEKIPQLGIAQLEDDVEIGCNTTVDRATMGETLVKRGAKIDNLVQVAHNVVIGENTVIAAQTGIAGSTKIGNNCMIGGQVGITGHIEIADNVVIEAQSGITKSITTPGVVYFGTPAKEMHRAFRVEAVIRSLPELMADVERMKRELAELRAQLTEQNKKS